MRQIGKHAWQIGAVICLAFSFQPTLGSTLPSKGNVTEVSSLSVPANGESLLSHCPVVPVAGIAKHNGKAEQGFHGKGLIHAQLSSRYDSSFSLSFDMNKALEQLPHALRLHLIFCVLLI